ncbi:MAG: barstar family protein [Clostridia bacterium]|nr:barstar family protein [Clostridia bacterium]
MIILDGKSMRDRQEIHVQLRQKLKLPEYYGNNLDALNDCLSERTGRELIVIENAGEMICEGDPYAIRLLRVFFDNGYQVLMG